MKACAMRWGLVVALIVGAAVARAETRTWKSNVTGDWAAPGSWNEGVVPTDGDAVFITNAGASAFLSGSSSNLASLTLSRPLTFTNWDTALFATNVTILTNGIMTLPLAFTTNQMSNRVWVVCSNFTIAAGGKIDADSKGYAGRNGPGRTMATSNGDRPGAGYGGFGGYGGMAGVGGATYGAMEAPTDPGSGGGDGVAVNAAGGGAVCIQASGSVTVNGLISANSVGRNGGTGSGGSVYINCRTFAGTNGLIRAEGGGAAYYGGGGGGRIAVIYQKSAQNDMPVPSVVFSAQATLPASGEAYRGDIGTLYFPDNRFLTGTLPHSGQWVGPGGLMNWNATDFVVSNSWLRFPSDGFVIAITNDVLITTRGKLELGGSEITNYASPSVRRRYGTTYAPPELRMGGSLILTNSSRLYVYAAATNPPVSPDYGALVSVGGEALITTGCWIYAYSQPTNGGSPLFRMRSLTIQTLNAGINADYAGFIRGYGPGKSTAANSGGGYGGKGGGSGGGVYGSSNEPVDPGCSSIVSSEDVGQGGGAVRIQARKKVVVNGLISANGAYGGSGAGGGAGSGGGVHIVCETFSGLNGAIQAKGGNSSYYGGGGGGRIAIWRSIDTSSGVSNNVTAAAGTGGSPAPVAGTVVWGALPSGGTVIVVR